VLAVKTDMGPFGYRGSAARAMQYLAETGATAVIAVGMAFGAHPNNQPAGDVLVSTGIIPYDYRTIEDDDQGNPVEDYSETTHFLAREQLVTRFRRAASSESWTNRVHFGLFLSGGARIYSPTYRDKLVRDCGVGRGDIIVGGEMEGVGFLSTDDPNDPKWILVKGISDFADRHSDSRDSGTRADACYNAVRFVFEALASLENSDA